MGHPDEVDIIVCGGGPAGELFDNITYVAVYSSTSPTGSVVAGRLAYADPSLKVMLIEGT